MLTQAWELPKKTPVKLGECKGSCCNCQGPQAWELRMEKSAEKWGSEGRRRPLVGVQGAMPPEAEAF